MILDTFGRKPRKNIARQKPMGGQFYASEEMHTFEGQLEGMIRADNYFKSLEGVCMGLWDWHTGTMHFCSNDDTFDFNSGRYLQLKIEFFPDGTENYTPSLSEIVALTMKLSPVFAVSGELSLITGALLAVTVN